MKTIFFSIILALPLASFAGKKLHQDVELQWKATTDLKEVGKIDLSKISESKIKVDKFSDARTIQPTTRIGEYSEDKEEVLPVDTKSDVTAFVSEGVKTTLSKAGLEIVDQAADYVLTGQVKEFYVTETNTYQGSVLVKFTLKKGDKVVWSGPITGTNKRFGRTYKLDNYMESLSDSVLDATVNLLQNEGFRKNWN